MKKIITVFCFFILIGISNAQQASEYFPAQIGFEWKFKAIPLDSVSNPITSLAYYRIDSFESVANYEGKLANIVLTKSGPLQTILLQPYLDSLFYHTDGTNGFEYFSINNIEEFLIQLDELGIDPNFSFVDFFTSLQNWYDVYRFASGAGTEYTLVQVDTSINYNSLNVPLRFRYFGIRLLDQTLQTVLGDLNCKKFVLNWNVKAYSIIDLITLSDTIWIAPDYWIVQDVIPGQYVDNLTFLGVAPFSIPGLDTKLTNEIVSVEDEKSIPNTFALEQNYPNPFNPTTKISWQSPVGSWQTLKVYDVLGNDVATLVDEYKTAGIYEVYFNALELPSGIYFYKLQAGSFVQTKKMVLLK